MKKVIYALLAIALWSGCRKEGDCRDGFTGDDCEIELTPQKVNIVSLASVVTSTDWDIFNGTLPDIFFVVESSTGAVILTSVTCDNSNDCSWSGLLPFDPNQTCVVKVFDEDGLGFRELMGEFSIDLYTNGDGFPSIETWSTLNGVTLRVGFTYTH